MAASTQRPPPAPGSAACLRRARRARYDAAGRRTIEPKELHITDNIEISPGVHYLRFPREWDFEPGQVVGVTVERRIEPRLYSIASAPGGDFIDLLYDVVPGGELTPLLAELQTGDTLFVTPPFGGFTDEPEGDSYWIATGTGVAPFLSMVRSGMNERKRLVHGSRTLAGFYFRKYFTNTLADRYICCCSAERGEGVYPGRLTSWLEAQPLPLDARYLLCGSAQMVVDVRDILIAKGIGYERIGSEIYF